MSELTASDVKHNGEVEGKKSIVKLKPARKAGTMAKRKTLGQIAAEAWYGSKDLYVSPKDLFESDWERAAAAVEREVLRRIENDEQERQAAMKIMPRNKDLLKLAKKAKGKA